MQDIDDKSAFDSAVRALEFEIANAGTHLTIDATAPAGPYTVAYRVLSADGHPISGSFAFTFTPDQIPGAGEAGAAPPAAVPTESTQVRDDTAQSGNSNRAFTWLFGAAAAGLAVAGVFVVLRGKRGRGAGAGQVIGSTWR